MARNKEFNIADAIMKAIDVFWSKGFEATSIQDLVTALKINRGSIYDTFGDKAGLFFTAINQYENIAPSQRLINNARVGNPKNEIKIFFSGLLAQSQGFQANRGCLMTNSITELANRNSKIKEHLDENLQLIEDSLRILIIRGQKTGDINPWLDPLNLASFLLIFSQGLNVITKVNKDNDKLLDVMETVLSFLD